MYRPLFRLSIKCVHHPPDVNVALTTDFPVSQLPVLYVVRFSSLPFSVHPHPTSDRPPTSLLPTDRRLYRRYLRRLEHTSSQEPDQPPQAIHNWVARAMSHHRGKCLPLRRLLSEHLVPQRACRLL